MNEGNHRFRRNFIACAVVHGVLIGALVLGEAFIAHNQNGPPAVVELITPADILGDLPKGDGYGRGAYTPPKQISPAESSQHGNGPSEATMASDEQPAPPQPAVKTPQPAEKTPPATPKAAPVEPGEIAIPKKGTPTKKTATASPDKIGANTNPARSTSKNSGATSNAGTAAKSGNTTKTTAKQASTKSGTGDGNGTGGADAIRQRLASALQAQEGGTPYGDNKPAGGGTGVSKYGRLGSPDGAENGVAGGVGKGTPFWWYYQQVHDRLYEGWDQPGEALNWDKRIVTTLSIRVARDGRVVAALLKNSSGNKLMDDSALAAANSVPRLDPLPEGLGDEFADILVNFRLENSKG
jgi:outer membrane biosynthesis protein TonB